MIEHLDETALNDAADDSLADDRRHDTESHLAMCAECRARVNAIRALRAELTALPRDIAPPAHVLMNVRARTGTRVAHFRSDAAAWHSRPRLLAAAAILLVALSSAATALLLRDSPVTDGHVAAPASTPPASASLVAVQAMERSYEDAIADLQRALDDQQSGLAPETLRILQANLDIIDRALSESRAALHADPGNDALTEMLRSGYERKLDVLRSVSSHARARS